MRTNIDIDDIDGRSHGGRRFITKREAVEEGMSLRRRKVYEGLLALQGQLQWDDLTRAGADVGPGRTREPGVLCGEASQAGRDRGHQEAARMPRPASSRSKST